MRTIDSVACSIALWSNPLLPVGNGSWPQQEAHAIQSYRPRISLNQLLLGVALVAMNCSVFRSVYGMVANVHNGYPLLTLLRFDDFENAYPPPRLLLSFAVGLIPLLNVLLIGIVRFAARWLRSARGEHAEDLRSPAAFTFFAIYFLGLSWIACMFIPAVIATYMVVAESSLERASDAFRILSPIR